MATSEAVPAQGEGFFDLLLKNPGASLQNETFQVQCPCNHTVGQLKKLLQQSYPGSPAPEAITLIYAGKVLKDNALVLSSFLPQHSSGPVAVHIVVKSPAAASSSPPSSSVPQQHMPAAAPEARTAASTSAAAQTTARPGPAAAAAATARADRPAPNSASGAAQSMFTLGAGMPPPSAAAVAMPPMFGAASSIYGPAYQAAYAAALHALMAHPSTAAAAAAAAGGEGAPQPVAVLPAMLPVPQPVLPAALWQSEARPASPEGQGVPNAPMQAYFVPVMPVQYAVQVPMPAQQAQQHVEARQLMADLRQRRRRLEAYLRAERQAMQEAGMEIPPHLQHLEDLENAAAAAAGRGRARRRGRPGGRAFQLRIRINVRALLQLGVLLLVVYQHCPPRRFLMLCAVGAVLWVSTHPRVRVFLQHLLHTPAHAPVGGEAPVGVAQQDGVGDGVAAAAAVPPEGPPEGGAALPGAPVAGAPPPLPAAQGGVLHQIQAFVAGFITSLLPAMDNLGGDADAGPMQDVFGGGGGGD